ncbi:unnamed protein product [Darwinula stevensoni]|uniref:Sulfhydryl oxidase n=1 Tax=Darwinula stevensoni TaxID=69355 RepID=A0A7R8X4W6_9CRUS|nr:unnamed protein product [Darwinula stevensoni]CAG0886003.1 unnamed protein product [Darwinula stevensoni]
MESLELFIYAFLFSSILYSICWRLAKVFTQDDPRKSQDQIIGGTNVPRGGSTSASAPNTMQSAGSLFPASSHSGDKVPTRPDCPLDVETLGQSTWNLLHTMAAYYPKNPTPTEQKSMQDFMQLFASFYPCSHCSQDFRDELAKNPPQTENQNAFSRWMCERHNKVNEKLGKPLFDCSKVDERWRNGWQAFVINQAMTSEGNLQGSIHPIDRQTVHRICSGQVVLNLGGAVKELVENALDAGATSVEVKLKENGLECIEVSDNGDGVDETNFQALSEGLLSYNFIWRALKHHTSKLKDFDDLLSVSTYGFRGEALSSLCALAKVTVITRHKDANVGAKLEYDHGGILVGTTVLLQSIFATLPVRYKELQRNIKKEFAKMVQILTAYCLIQKNVRISCTNQSGKNRQTTHVLATQGCQTLSENIRAVFGYKQMQSLISFKQEVPSEEILTQFGLDLPTYQETATYEIEGFLSSCQHGQGRSSTDRQFYFINSRPCDFPKLSRLVNEVYHSFNRDQYPFACLDIHAKSDAIDINVTPDKRQILVQNEKALLAIVKASLLKMFETYPSRLISLASSITSPSVQDKGDQPPKTLAFFKNTNASGHGSRPTTEDKVKQLRLDTFTSRKLESGISKSVEFWSQSQPMSSVHSPSKKRKPECLQASPIHKSLRIEGSTHKALDAEPRGEENQDTMDSGLREKGNFQEPIDSGFSSQDSAKSDADGPLFQIIFEPPIRTRNQEESQEDRLDSSQSEEVSASKELRLPEIEADVVEEVLSVSQSISQEGHSSERFEDDQPRSPEAKFSPTRLPEVKQSPGVRHQEPVFDESAKAKRVVKEVPFCFQSLKEALTKSCFHVKEGKKEVEGRKFRAKISPSDNSVAEDELRRELTKDMFPQMEILGQFNLGFIITRLGPDLFIVDQHASDEKYNFENLQRNTVIQSQKLIVPMNLDLTAVAEATLIDNLPIFERNGFSFLIDASASPGSRVRLASIPESHNWSFGKQDVEELLFMLSEDDISESNVARLRPSRVRAMFASRACRSSVMIGTALSKLEMRRLVDHMALMDQPWNCPHGRPTIRHLVNLDLLRLNPLEATVSKWDAHL